MNKIFYFSLIYFFIEIRIFLSQICGKKEPKNITDCIENSYEDQACCFITYNQTVYGCLFVPQNSTFITQYINSIDFGLDQLFTIKIDCGKDQEKDKRICARNPSNKFDCFQNTNSTYDCCFFQTPDQDLCLWNDWCAFVVQICLREVAALVKLHLKRFFPF